MVFDGRVDNCACWGFIVDNPAHNEVSGITLGDFFIQGCGTTSANAVPPSGGMKWKGQGLHFSKAFFTVNENCGIYLTGGPNAANGVTFDLLVLENTKKIAWFIEGAIGVVGSILQIYQNDTYLATNGIGVNAAVNAVLNIDISLVLLRVTTGNNPHTAFSTSGSFADLTTINIRHVRQLLYGGTGQTLYSNWTP